MVIIGIGIWLLRRIVSVSEGETMVIERWGRVHRALSPGYDFIIPFAESAHTFQWIREEDTNKSRLQTTLTPYDMKDIVCRSKDGVTIRIHMVIKYKIVDAKKVAQNVRNLYETIYTHMEDVVTKIMRETNSIDASEGIIEKESKSGNGKDVWEKYGIEVKECRVKPLVIGGSSSGGKNGKKWRNNESDDSGEEEISKKSLPLERDQKKRHDIETQELKHRIKLKEEKCRAKCMRKDIEYAREKSQLKEYLEIVRSSGYPPEFFIRYDNNRAISEIMVNPNTTKVFMPHCAAGSDFGKPLSNVENPFLLKRETDK